MTLLWNDLSSHRRRPAARQRDSAEREWLDRVRLWAAAIEDCLWIDRVVPWQTCRVAGVVRRLRLDPGGGCVEATITDGAATLAARWAVRIPSPHLRACPGRGLVLEGLARVDADGSVFMVEPEFEVRPGPGGQ